MHFSDIWLVYLSWTLTRALFTWNPTFKLNSFWANIIHPSSTASYCWRAPGLSANKSRRGSWAVKFDTGCSAFDRPFCVHGRLRANICVYELQFCTTRWLASAPGQAVDTIDRENGCSSAGGVNIATEAAFVFFFIRFCQCLLLLPAAFVMLCQAASAN